MASPPISNIPVALFPLKLETRFVSDELWIRAFPDMAFLQSHEARLTYQERADAVQFKQSPTEEQKQAWGELVNKYGVYRASWIVQISEAEIDAQEQAASESGEKANDQAPEFYFKWLPDRLVFYLYKSGGQTPAFGAQAPAYVKEGSLINRDGLTVLGDSDEWLRDFDLAISAGMGVKISLNAGDVEFERVIASGIRYAEDPLVPAQGLVELFQNHQYTEGLSMLRFGTPTNNTSSAKSGFSSRDEYDAKGSFDFAVAGLDLDTVEEPTGILSGTAGNRLSAGLGIDATALQHTQQADIIPPKLNGLFQKATWFAMGAQPLFALFGNEISSEKHLAIWEHYSRFVQARGAYSALKIGNQPYGFLPVMNVRKVLSPDEGAEIRNSEELFDQLWEILAHVMNRWTAMAKNNRQALPRLEDAQDSYTEILKILSMQEYSSIYQIRPLEYNHFKKKLYDWLRLLRTEATIDVESSALAPGSLLNQSLGNAMTARNSLVNLFSEDLVDPDRLVQSPILSMEEANANLIRFQERDSVISDRFGKQVIDENGVAIDQGDQAFSLVQEDLSDFQELITKIKTGNCTNLFDYQSQGDQSLFVDLFLRSYSNARQLYHRDVTNEFTTDELRQFPALKVGAVLKAVNSSISFGEPVMEIVGADGSPEDKKIVITSPMTGTMTNLFAAVGAEVQANSALFSVSIAILGNQTVYLNASLADTKGYMEMFVGPIQKQTGDLVSRGDTVLEIHRVRNGIALPPLVVTAPFDGQIEKLRVNTGDDFHPGKSLFSLINTAQVQAIDNQFAELGQQIIEACSAISDPGERKQAQMEAIREVVDINSYRLDAWITSLATRRVEEMRSRAEYRKGIYFGAYGWVEGLKKNTLNPVDKATRTDTYRGEGGIIHATSSAQAVASAIFKNSFMSYKDIEATNPFTLNLISDRLQKSQMLLDGIRQGQELEALLGYQLERYLHEHPNGGLHNEIYILREAYPLYENITGANGQNTGFTNLSVIDGLKAIENKANLPVEIDSAVRPVIVSYIEKLEDVLDGSLDALFYEAGFQVTQGNLSHAAAALDAAKGEIEPPEIESIKTRVPGVGLSHKLIVGMPAPSTSYPIENARAFAEPVLENWLTDNIGNLQRIGLSVELTDTDDGTMLETVDLSLQDLGVGYLDMLYLSRDPVDSGASELELRIRKRVIELRGEELSDQIQYHITDPFMPGLQPLARALEFFRSAYTLLSKCRFLKSEDLHLESETIEFATQALDRIRSDRLMPILDRMKSIVESGFNEANDLQFLARLDLEIVKMTVLGEIAVPLEKLEAAVNDKVAAAEAALAHYNTELEFNLAFEILERVAKILFGSNFILLPPALGSADFSQLLKSPVQRVLIGDKKANTKTQIWGQERVQDWIQGLAQVHENAEIFEDWQMARKAWEVAVGLPQSETYRVVQGPTMDRYPWLALSKAEIETLLETEYQNREIFNNSATGETYPLSNGAYYPDGCDSTVIYATNEFTLEDQGAKTPVFGLVVEEFAEHIPNEKVDTGLSFHYNAPNSEPPQAILLAVHPKAMFPQNFAWSEDDLRDIIYDTMDLFKVRMVDTDAMQEYGYLLPMINWYNISTVYNDR